MNVSIVLTRDYKNDNDLELYENKPNQTQPVVSLSNLFQRQKSAVCGGF